MTPISLRSVVLVLAASSVIFAQQPPADPQSAPTSNPAWRRAGDPPQTSSAQDPQASQGQAPADAYGQMPQQPANQPPAAQAPRPAYGVPAQVTLKAGALVTLRIAQRLSSGKNAPGDTFSGALTLPVVVNGIVVAQRGQMVFGRVAEADKVKGVHRLGIELTSITLADGSSAPIHSQLMSRQGPQGPMMPYGHRDEGVITTSTAGGSTPAPGAPVVSVLATKGHDSVMYPGTVLTFQIENAVTVNTASSNGAFRYVSPDDYSQSNMNTQVATRPSGGYGAGYAPYGYPYPYWGYGYPYWGPAIGFGFGFGGFYGFRGGFRR